MKHLISILLILVIGCQTTYQGIVYAYYTLQKQYITTTYCVNKAKPQLKCDGKCHLRNLLAVSENVSIEQPNEPVTPPSLLDGKPLVLFWQQLTTFALVATFDSPSWLLPELYDWYHFDYQYLPIFQQLQPPQLLTIFE